LISGPPAVSIDFDELDTGTNVSDLYDGVVFSTSDGDVESFDGAGLPQGTSPFNVIRPTGTSDFYADFDPPVDDLQLMVTGDTTTSATTLTVFFGSAESTSVPIPIDGDPSTAHFVDLSAFASVTRISYVPVDGEDLFFDDFAWGGSETIDCVIKGGPNETLDLWIDGGSTPSDVAGGETVCKKDEAGMPGGGGDEICGARLVFQLVGFGQFSEFVTAPGMDTLVLGEECASGTPPNCVFQTSPPVKDLHVVFLSGASDPSAGRRRLGSLIVDSTGLDTADPGSSTEINVLGTGVGGKLQLREIPLIEPNEIVAAIPVPEPGRFVQLLTGVFALAGLRRLRRQR
jgi:hypothetical protein